MLRAGLRIRRLGVRVPPSAPSSTALSESREGPSVCRWEPAWEPRARSATEKCLAQPPAALRSMRRHPARRTGDRLLQSEHRPRRGRPLTKLSLRKHRRGSNTHAVEEMARSEGSPSFALGDSAVLCRFQYGSGWPSRAACPWRARSDGDQGSTTVAHGYTHDDAHLRWARPGRLARNLCKQGVRGSSPLSST